MQGRINSANFRLSREAGSALSSIHNNDMPTTDTTIAQLETARAYAASLQEVTSAEIWVPTPEEIAEYAADGITARPRLLVTVWRSERNPSDVKWDIEHGFGLDCVSDGSSTLGPCYEFEVSAA